MSIQYTVMPNPLREGEYYPRPVWIRTRRAKDIANRIAAKSSFSTPDVYGVLLALQSEIADALLNGERVVLDGIVDFRPNMKQVLQSGDDPFQTRSGGQLSIVASAMPAILKKFRANAHVKKIIRAPRMPQPVCFHDTRTGRQDRYSPGGSARIIGYHLRIRNEAADDEGIFFIGPDGTETKVSFIQDNFPKQLAFEIPRGLTGEQRLEVRTRFSRTGTLRAGTLQGVLQGSVQ